jgi:D-arabinose 1-dehydrogenase
MKARVLMIKKFGQPLLMDTVDIMEPDDDEAVLLKVHGAGMCRTDLRLWRGEEPREGFSLPFVLGHENAGTVEAVGRRVRGFQVGDRVIVYAIWSDLTCRYCRAGLYMQCRAQAIPGQSYYYGGYAEYLYVPSFRFLVKIDIDPVDAAPLADAGLSSYSAVKKALGKIYPGSLVVVYGVGALASYAIQYLRVLAPQAKILAVSRSGVKLRWARELGAHEAVRPEDLEESIKRISSEGASVILDFVGNEVSATTIKLLEPGGLVVLVGMEGKNYPIPVFEGTVWQYQIVGSNYGTISEMEEVVRVVRDAGIRSFAEKVRFEEEEVNRALIRLEKGEVLGRFVISPTY